MTDQLRAVVEIMAMLGVSYGLGFMTHWSYRRARQGLKGEPVRNSEPQPAVKDEAPRPIPPRRRRNWAYEHEDKKEKL